MAQRLDLTGRTAIGQTMCDGLAVNHLDVFDRLQISDGPCGLAEIGPVVMAAAGPGREDRRWL
ncbi:MAG: hypothetical protein LBK42_08385 [Propionibacteriaceae bacterium]|nr:hypothetical protein [Propionibacteriaceae bacterium]